MISSKNRRVIVASGVAVALLVGSAAADGWSWSQPKSGSLPGGWDVFGKHHAREIATDGFVQQVQQQQQQQVQLRIINTLPGPIDYYVVNPNTGQTQRINALQPGGVADLGSQPGLRWIFVQNQQQIQSYQTRSEPFQELRIAAPGQQQPPRLANQFQPPANSQGGQQQAQQPARQLGQQAQPQPLGQPGTLGQPLLQRPQSQQQALTQQPGFQPVGPGRPLGQQQGQALGQQQQSGLQSLGQGRPLGQQQGQPFGQQQPPGLQTLGQRPQLGQQFGQQNTGQGQQRQGQQGQPGQGQAQFPQQPMQEPPGLYQSGLTIDQCMKSYFAPGSSAIAICRYLSQLAQRDPGAYQNYLASVQLRNNQSGGSQGQQQGFGNSSQGFGNTQQGRFPEAASWGGIVRSQPSVQSDRLDSLVEGEVITLVADTGVEMNGYNWFQIQYREGQSGYQWGGIICGQTQPIPGTFEICN